MLTALQHKEPDKVPFDLGGTSVTGIHRCAYQRLVTHLGIDARGFKLHDTITQRAEISEEICQRLKVDVRMIDIVTKGEVSDLQDEGNYTSFTDDFGIKWAMPKRGGLYYDMRAHPLSGSITVKDVQEQPLPPLPEPANLQETKWSLKESPTDYALTVAAPGGGGIFELASWLRGFKEFYMDLAGNPSLATLLLDRLTDFKIQSWDRLLDAFGDMAQIALEADDLSTQEGLLISPAMYRRLIKPRHKRLFEFIKKKSQAPIYIFFHSCGAVYDLIPDLIDAGVDILNPVQVSAAKMDTRRLKKEFGDELVFWGGGVDTQHVLPHGTSTEVRDEVKRRIDDLAPGGGFIFAAVHNIQADVPPENIMAMWEVLQEYGVY